VYLNVFIPCSVKIKISTALCVIVLFSCNQKENSKVSYIKQEDSLFHHIVDSIVQPDSLIAFDDTARLFIAINSRLVRFSIIPEYNYVRENPKFYFKYIIRIPDTAYFDLFNRIISDKKLKKRNIDITGFHARLNYKIIPANFLAKGRIDSSQVAEIHNFSRIVFNSKFDKACFYDQIRYRTKYPEDYMLFLEKKNGLWRIVKKSRL
jgi:hypothetical protein